MTSPTRRTLTAEEALAEVRRVTGTHLDPNGFTVQEMVDVVPGLSAARARAWLKQAMRDGRVLPVRVRRRRPLDGQFGIWAGFVMVDPEGGIERE